MIYQDEHKSGDTKEYGNLIELIVRNHDMDDSCCRLDGQLVGVVGRVSFWEKKPMYVHTSEHQIYHHLWISFVSTYLVYHQTKHINKGTRDAPQQS